MSINETAEALLDLFGHVVSGRANAAEIDALIGYLGRQLDLLSARTSKVIGQRPTHTPDGDVIPAGWRIVNAPRPLAGDLTWESYPFRGCFYAAINRFGPNALAYQGTAIANDGVFLEYVTEENALVEALYLYVGEFPEEEGEIDPADRHQRQALLDYWLERQRG